MAEYAYPMDSKVTYNGNGIPSFDRAVTSAQLRGMISEIITNGVLMANNSNALRVIANGDKSVTIQPGLCVINGAIKKFTEAKTMQVPVPASADTNYRGIAICALFDLNSRDIRLVHYIYSAESATDLIPLNGKDSIDRTDARYAIQLANIYIAPGYTRIVQSDITDTRLDTERCGAVSSISQFDTTNLYNQIQSDLASFKSTEQAEFQEWFENLQTVLDSNTAAHLQNEIDGLSGSKVNKSDITNISITGTTNNTGSNIPAGTLFYLNSTLCKALTDIASGATFTEGTNYVSVNLRHGKHVINHTFTLNPTSSTDFVNAFEYTIPDNCLYSISAIQNYGDGGQPNGVRILAHKVGTTYNCIYAENRDAASFGGRTVADTVFIVQFKSSTPNATQMGYFTGWFEYTD
jgi:hypothetical protein